MNSEEPKINVLRPMKLVMDSLNATREEEEDKFLIANGKLLFGNLTNPEACFEVCNGDAISANLLLLIMEGRA